MSQFLGIGNIALSSSYNVSINAFVFHQCFKKFCETQLIIKYL